MTVRPITDDDLQAYVDRALDARRMGDVEAYLAHHPEAEERVATYRRQHDLLRDALAPVAAEPIPAELNLANLIEGVAERPRSHATKPWRSAAAAVLLLGIGGAAGWGLRFSSEQPRAGIASLAQEAADSYAVYAPDQRRPVEIRAAEEEQLTSWASRRLQRPVPVPDLSASGFRFLGGRLVATPHGPAVLYMFDDRRGVRLVMLARNMAFDKDTPMAERANGSVGSVTWSRRGLGFSLVGPLTPASLHPIADEARQKLDVVS